MIKELAPEMNADKAKALASRARTSVSAEAFGKYHKKETFKSRVIQKSDAIKEK
jgi:hypothetical protein